MTRETRITIDLRMYRHSGIGRYLRNLLPRLLPLLQADIVRIITTPGLIGDDAWLLDPRIEIFNTKAAVYSLAEQLLRFRGAYRYTDLLWVPHFNAPLFYRQTLVVTIHDIAYIALPELLDNRIKRAYSKLLIERATAHAAAILCVSSLHRKGITTTRRHRSGQAEHHPSRN